MKPDEERPKGPDERPAGETPTITQELNALLYEFAIRLESGLRGRVHVRWTETGELTASIGGPAVRLINRIRRRDDDA